MEKVLRQFDSHGEADKADRAYYKSLTVDQRLQHFLQMMEPVYAAHPRLQRIYRVIDRSQSPVRDGGWMGIQYVRPTEDDR